jgi:hypothetical protein
MTDQIPSGPFSKDQIVPAEGDYVCVPCGYHHHYHAGEKFTECISCLAGTSDGHEDFIEGQEMWEPVQPVVADAAATK